MCVLFLLRKYYFNNLDYFYTEVMCVVSFWCLILVEPRLLAPLTDSILVEAAHQPQFPCPKVKRENRLSEIYSIDFNDLAVQIASASNSVFEAVRQTLHITVCKKVCGQTT